MIVCPERVLVIIGGKTADLVLIVSSLAFFFVSFSLLRIGGDFPTMHGMSAKGFSKGVDGTSGVSFSSDKFTIHLARICTWGYCCATVL